MLNDITPANFVCHTDDCCPAVFETDAGSVEACATPWCCAGIKQISRYIESA